jgi:protein gp37
MGANSKIEWTDDTDNPIVVKDGGWYCTKVSEGCKNCYAESLNHSSYYGGNGLDYKHLVSGPPKLHLKREMLAGWAKKTKPKKRFVSSMTDILGEFVPDEWVFEIWDAQLAAPLQTFLDLTKRAERLHQLATRWLEMRGLSSMPPNIWPMVSVENQERANERIPWLLKVPAFVRGLSAEPLLGPVDLTPYLGFLPTDLWHLPEQEAKKHLPVSVNWVIVGGESGPGARPMHPEWVRSLRDQCQAAGVAFFFKQWGNWYPQSQKEDSEVAPLIGSYAGYSKKHWTVIDGKQFENVGKAAAGRLLDGVEYSEFPALEKVAA